ncbi:hypothetical protein G7Y79_00021g051070 [Physcia stellaris]|nr:hypothetical protein G7Y79_00021g051070 [Physcia stellaris]
MRLSHLLPLATLSLFPRSSLTRAYTPCIDPNTELQIRNRLALFAQAIDFDQYSLFREVFTANVNATFGPPYTPYIGLQAVEEANSFFKNVTTQISISSIVVNCTDQQAPESVSYFLATNFVNETDLSLSYGKYFDQWVKEGAAWKIQQRRTSVVPGNPFSVQITPFSFA